METFEKKCVDCGESFVINEEDKSFCEKMKVPLGRRCFACGFANRMVFRNERTLYKRKCDAPGHTEEMISLYAPEKEVVVYDREFWWGDGWDAYSYGHDYDFSRPFFEQVKELIQTVPWPSLMNWNAVNSDFCNCTSDNKNCYLVFGGDFNEDCSYSTFNMHSRDSQDLYLVHKCDLCYECTDAEECFKVRFSQYVKSCSDSYFLYDCVNCTNCIGCFGLRNKSNCIWNEQYTKAEYDKKIKELSIDTRSGLESIRSEFKQFMLRYPHRFAHIMRSVGSTGENITNAKNCINCFDVEGPTEDLKDVFLAGWGLKDTRSSSHVGHSTELVWESFGIFSGCQNVRFSIYQQSSVDATYSYNCPGSSNIFGCVGVRDGNYVILNKQYTKEEYNELVPKIIEHMNTMPYVDARGNRAQAEQSSHDGKEYRFGDFFPSELSPFSYNETIAFDYYPLTKEEALEKGYTWRDQDAREYKITKQTADLPESITDTDNSILKDVIACAHAGKCNDACTTAFRIVPQELQFYKRLGLPLPTLCPSCRHYARLRSRNPMQLWSRSCQCTGTGSKNNLYLNTAGHAHGNSECELTFETAYSPERPEIVYCEECYQREVN